MATVNCDHAAQKEEDKMLDEIIEKYGQKKDLIPVLQEIQKHYGYLPEKSFYKTAEGLNISLRKVYGVATFYAQFHLQPRGRWVIRVCQGTACHVRGAKRIMDKVQEELGIMPGETTEDLRFTIEPVACIGCCGLAPVMMINDNTHGRLTSDMIPGILEQYE